MPEVQVVRLSEKNGVARAQIKIGQRSLPAQPLLDFTDPVVRSALERLQPGDPPITCLTEDTGDPSPASLRYKRPPVVDDKVNKDGEFNDNPYNFAEWAGGSPWPADDVKGATHEQWHDGRRSGVLEVKLDAKRPIFVPEGGLPKAKSTFWGCPSAEGQDHFGIPGSSIKGVIRTLFETWTNSRLGIVSTAAESKKDNYRPIPYRRRSAQAWAVVAVSPDGSMSLKKCDGLAIFAKWNPVSKKWEYKPDEPHKPPRRRLPPSAAFVFAPALDPANTTDWQALELRANLLWTPDHKHFSTHVLVKVTTTSGTIAADAMTAYRQMLKHRAFEEHNDRILDITRTGLGDDYYKDITLEPIEQRLEELGKFNRGDLIFGPDPARTGKPACFGRNVNFLWPAGKSPKDLIGEFWPRDDQSVLATGTDPAEATFGFAGAYSKQGHPFQGRVRFTTFWAKENPRVLPEVPLAELTSPTGVKLKARPLYLPPHPQTGLAQNYDEVSTLRGRKFYWHQRTSDRRIAHVRTGVRNDQCPDPFRPLAPGTEFVGEIHFDNLSNVELGALLVSLVPDLFWRAKPSDPGYGYAIGKAKPRGLGSVRPALLDLKLRSHSYGDFDEPALVTDNAVAEEAVRAFRTWLDARAQDILTVDYPDASALPFVRDLAKLLSLTPEPAIRTYVSEPGRYGWMPEFEDPKGDPNPNHGRKIAMPRARFL